MPLLIAIAGGSGAGKSTLAHAVIAARAPAETTLIREDDYYICASAIARFDADTHNFDAPASKDRALMAAHLEAARAGRAFDTPRYDLKTHRRLPEGRRVAPADLVIVEGLHVFTEPQLAALYDLRVFIEADQAVRRARRLARDQAERARSASHVTRQFETHVAPMHERFVAPQRAAADLILVSGAEAPEIHAARVLAALAAIRPPAPR